MNNIDRLILGLSILRSYNPNPKISSFSDYVWVELSKELQDTMIDTDINTLNELGWYKDSFTFGWFVELY